jgi:hypothetical protein
MCRRQFFVVCQPCSSLQRIHIFPFTFGEIYRGIKRNSVINKEQKTAHEPQRHRRYDDAIYSTKAKDHCKYTVGQIDSSLLHLGQIEFRDQIVTVPLIRVEWTFSTIVAKTACEI